MTARDVDAVRRVAVGGVVAAIGAIAVIALPWGAIAIGAAGPDTQSAPVNDAAGGLHAALDTLLARHVRDGRVDYATWARTPGDLATLRGYIDRIEKLDPASLDSSADRLAGWINLYNAATLDLVLRHFPVSSIRDIGGEGASPWKIPFVSVGGRELTLDGIENDIIRPGFGDPRVHFALNCAAVGCPPLADRAFTGDAIDEELDAACRRTINDARWVRYADGVLHLTKIFEWYAADFTGDGRSVVGFVIEHLADESTRRELERRLRDGGVPPRIEYIDYDWSLNGTQ